MTQNSDQSTRARDGDSIASIVANNVGVPDGLLASVPAPKMGQLLFGACCSPLIAGFRAEFAAQFTTTKFGSQ